MIWRCSSCQGDIVVRKRPRSSTGRCPHCSKPYFVMLNEQGELKRLVFDSDMEGGFERQCARCGRLFRMLDPRDPMPICSACKTGEFELDTSGTQWSVRKSDGREFGPTTLEEIRQLASKGLLVEGDLIKGPATPWKRVGTAEELRGYFTPQRSIPQSKRKTPSRRRRRRMAKWFTWLFLVAVAAFVGHYFFWDKIKPSVPGGKSEQARAQETPYELVLKELESDAKLQTTEETVLVLDIQGVEQLLAADLLADYKKVVILLKRLLVKSRQSPVVAGLLGEALVHLFYFERDFKLKETALVLASESLKLDNSQPYGYRAKIAAMLEAKNFKAALLEIEKAQAAHPLVAKDKRMRLYHAVALMHDKERYTEALDILLALDKENSTPLRQYWLVEAYAKQGDYRKALQQARAFNRKQPGRSKTLLQLGVLSELSGESKRALEFYQQALKALPTLIEARLRLSVLYYQSLNQPEYAERNLKNILSRYASKATASDNKYAHFHLCSLYYQKASYKDAVKACDLSFAISPYFVPLLMRRASIFAALNRGADQLATLERARVIAPDSDQVLVTLSKAYQQGNFPDKALRLVSEGYSKKPTSLLLLVELISLYARQEQVEEAERILRRDLYNVWLDDERQYYKSGMDATDAIDWQPYTKMLSELAKKRPESAAIATAKALTAVEQQDVISAKKILRKALAADESFLPSYMFLADIYNREGRFQQAFKLLERFSLLLSKNAYGSLVFFETLVGVKKVGRAGDLVRSLKIEDSPFPCRVTVAKHRFFIAKNQGDKLREQILKCAAAPNHYRPATELIMAGKVGVQGGKS